MTHKTEEDLNYRRRRLFERVFPPILSERNSSDKGAMGLPVFERFLFSGLQPAGPVKILLPRSFRTPARATVTIPVPSCRLLKTAS
jgi:hypothetical protein